MLNWGTDMLPNGLTLLIAPIALAIAEFAVATSFWIDVRMPDNVFVMKVLIWEDDQHHAVGSMNSFVPPVQQRSRPTSHLAQPTPRNRRMSSDRCR